MSDRIEQTKRASSQTGHHGGAGTLASRFYLFICYESQTLATLQRSWFIRKQTRYVIIRMRQRRTGKKLRRPLTFLVMEPERRPRNSMR